MRTSYTAGSKGRTANIYHKAGNKPMKGITHTAGKALQNVLTFFAKMSSTYAMLELNERLLHPVKGRTD
jgi:hypothetical protein